MSRISLRRSTELAPLHIILANMIIDINGMRTRYDMPEYVSGTVHRLSLTLPPFSCQPSDGKDFDTNSMFGMKYGNVGDIYGEFTSVWIPGETQGH